MLTEPNTTKHSVNPLATRFVAPGRVPWIGIGESALDFLAQKFQTLHRRCQIIGPHGSGKSTLLEHLVPLLAKTVIRIDVHGKIDFDGHSCGDLNHAELDQDTICWFSLRRGCNGIDRWNQFRKQPGFNGILVIDGAEQLNWWSRIRLGNWAGRRGCGLLVTSHGNLGLATLYKASVTPPIAKEVVRHAMQTAQVEFPRTPRIDEIDWNSRLASHQGNLRECLMDLYDEVEIMMREANKIGS